MADTKALECPICNSNNVGNPIAIPDNEYGLPYKNTYYYCYNCHCFFQVPMPDLKTLAGYYPANYHSMDNKSLIGKMKSGSRLRRLHKLIEKRNKFTLLDYGCGDGSFLAFVAEKKPEAQLYGYEIGEKDEVIKRGNNIIIYKGSVDFMLKNIPLCTIITMNHVIEHLPDPYETVNGLASKLEAGGVLEGQTPNTDSVERSIFGIKWAGFHAPRHTVVFSKRSLQILFKRIGLTGVAVTVAFNPAGYGISFPTLFNSPDGGIIVRKGTKWLFFVGIAILCYPLDMIKPGIVNFCAIKGTNG